jgi:serine/threonine-protein kinase RsbW
MQKRRILIVDNNDDLRAILENVLGSLGYDAVVTGDRDEALSRDDLDQFDVIISDLTEEDTHANDQSLVESNGKPERELHRRCLLTPVSANAVEPVIVKAFKMVAANYLRLPYNKDELREIVEQTLAYKLRYVDDPSLLSHTHEKIEFELPSDLALMNGVLQYLLERVAKLGLIAPERSNLFIALDEAFVNAVKHGNKNDPTKLVRVSAELSPKEACFTIEDEGEGFNVQTIPDPCDPANLFKSSGRGVLLIYNIMDEVEYNAQGNRVKMVKRPEPSVETQLVEPGTPNDKHAGNV